ncbi:MAG: NAD(P)-binding domain-containing protein [Thermomicrobiales bacterium]
MEAVETIIVGGGQAGLATSYYLTQYGREHVVLEQAARPAHVWSDERWDSFTLVTPNWTFMIPGAVYDGPDADGYMRRDEIAARFANYVERFRLPVQCNTSVTAIEPVDGGGYKVQTSSGDMQATNVVIATGMEQYPKLPPFAGNLSADITQLHSSAYRNPDALPPGAVLVVGSAQSGAQIAEELYLSGREVFLCVGSAGRAPRRYRGQDVFKWLYQIGFFDLTPDKFPFPIDRFSPPHLTGANGGRTLNLHQFARDGVTLLGHLRSASGDTITLAPDLHETLQRVDGFEVNARNMIDGFIKATGRDAPEEELPQLRDGYDQPIIEDLDLKAAGISTVIWATGYTFDLGLVKAPIFNENGFPIQDRGVTRQPGLAFVGMPWMPSIKPATLTGVAESARHVVETIVGARAGERQEDMAPVSA